VFNVIGSELTVSITCSCTAPSDNIQCHIRLLSFLLHA